MKRRVVAIGLDSADPDVLERWFREGSLPHLARLVNTGAYARLENRASYLGRSAPYASTEGSWVMLQTGVGPEKTGYWETIGYDPQSYVGTCDQQHGGYDYGEYKPFFALGDEYRVATFDLPVTAVCPGVNGPQIVGWGGHFPFVKRGSSPASLLPEVVERYGKNEVLYRDYGVFWKRAYLKWLEETSVKSAITRGRICLDLLAQERWDLFLAAFGETHGASHDLWFCSHEEHPVHHTWKSTQDPLRNVFEAVDRQIGALLDASDENTYFACYSAHGMQSNVSDVLCFFMLAELLYRFNFPGRCGISQGDPRREPRAPFTSGRHWYWFGDIWRQKYSRSPLWRTVQPLLPGWLVWPPGKDLLFPYLLDFFGPQIGWMPTVWYQPAWPRMRSFALPSFADGHIRLNVRDRDAKGLVDAADYDQECDRITEFLLDVKHGRTGRPIIRQVLRTRRTAHDEDPRLPHADLVVIWEDEPVDVVDSPSVGRIGPVPFYRTGGHRNTGFFAVRGPGIPQGTKLPTASVLDVAPTLLSLLGAPVPGHFDGQPLLRAAERGQALVAGQ